MHPTNKKVRGDISLKMFKQKFQDYFQSQFRIYMAKDILSICKCPKELIEYFGKTPFMLKPKNVRDDEQLEENNKIAKRNIPWYMYLPIFIMNRVPSDIYRN